MRVPPASFDELRIGSLAARASLTEGKTLAEAIHELKPELNAKAEVERARGAARSDLAG
jgi:hypothetical protein